MKQKSVRAYARPAVLNFLLAGLVLALSGCGSTNYKGNGVGPLIEEGQVNSGIAVVTTLRKVVTTGDTPLVADTCFNASGGDAGCMAGRNRAIAALRIASDDLCATHIRGIYGNETTANMLTGTGAVLASGWATVSGGLATKSALSGISTFFNAERSLLNEVYFKEQVVTAVTSKIRQIRVEKSAQLDKYYEDDMTDYPMMRAISDVVAYHYSCSFVYGLEKALEEGQTSTSEIKRNKLELERGQLQNALDVRISRVTVENARNDAGIAGLTKRIKAIDDELERLTTGVSSKQGSTQPDLPTDIKVESTSGKITVSFSAPKDGGSTITEYVMTANNNDPKAGDKQSASTSGKNTNLSVNCTTGGEYTLTLAANNAAGSSSAYQESKMKCN